MQHFCSGREPPFFTSQDMELAMSDFYRLINTFDTDPSLVFDWVAVPLPAHAALLDALSIKVHGYSKFQGGQSTPVDGCSGLRLRSGWFILANSQGTYFRPKHRPPFGTISRETPLLVGRRYKDDVGCEWWEKGRRRWRVTTLDGETETEGELPAEHSDDSAVAVCVALTGFDPTAIPVPEELRFIRYVGR